MAIAVQIGGVTAILGLDPEMPMTWTSQDAALAARLNEDLPHYRGYRPDSQLAEAQAVVTAELAKGTHASIVIVDPEPEPQLPPDTIY